MQMVAIPVSRPRSGLHCPWTLIIAFITACAMLVTTACRAPEDENYPGYCRLSCSNTSIGASNFKFNNILFPADYECGVTESGYWASLAKWVIVSPIRRVDNTEVEVERPAIAFFPRYGGGYYDPTYLASRGIITPESEWCSDACGVATVTVSSTCPSSDDGVDHKYLMTIQSGAVVSDDVAWTVSRAKAD